jgi:hypothetical protein
MRTTDLFKNNRSSKKLNESLSKTFGTKLDLESFDTPKLEDARNKLRTQIHTARQESGFNETIENETLSKAQFMHDAIVAELMDREEHIVDTSVQEGNDEVASVLGRIADEEDFDALYELFSDRGPVGEYLQDQIADITGETGLHPKDDFERIEGMIMDRIQQEFGGQSNDDEGGETDDGYALASAGFGSDEDYESIETEDESSRMSMAQELYKSNPDLDSEDDILNAGFAIMKQRDGAKAARYYFSYDEDFPSDFISEYKWLQRQEHDVGEATGRDAYQRDYDSSVSGMGRRERENDEGDTEPPNNFAVSINGKQWKVFKGRGQYADDSAERNHYQQLRAWAAKKSESTGKKWEVHVTGAPATESIQTELSKNTLKSYQDKAGKEIVHTMTSGDYMTTDKSAKKVMNRMRGSEKADNKIYKKENESIQRTQGESMSNLREGEVQQASAIVTAKTMVDRISRWIEELSSMENDTLLQLGDSIRDEMGQEQAKAFISSVAPAIQQALENLKSTRETMATGVRQLTGEEQGAEMLGGEPAGMGGDEMGPAEPDAMNMGGDIGGEDEFAAAEPAAGGLGDAGREQRESINRSSSLLKVLAG